MEDGKRLVMDGQDITKEVKAMVGYVNLNDPKSNYYRVFKQLLLIEEHIAVKALNCRLCCFKHASTAVALLDEISQLDGNQLYTVLNTHLHGVLDGLPWRFTVHDGTGPTPDEYAAIGKDVRVARKYLMESYFFPKKTIGYSTTLAPQTTPPNHPTVYPYSGPSLSSHGWGQIH